MFENLGRPMRLADTLKFQCDACGHKAAFDRAIAFQLFTPDASPFEISRRAKCRYCDVAGRVAVWI
jgi:hypothetical protein